MLGYQPPQIRHHPSDQTPPGPGRHPPRPGRHHPPDQTPPPPGSDTPQTRHPPNHADTPGPGRHHPPPDQIHPPTRQSPPPGSRLQHTVYERPVRILLECILVSECNLMHMVMSLIRHASWPTDLSVTELHAANTDRKHTVESGKYERMELH